MGAPTKYTLEELDSVETRLNESTSWLRQTSERQRNLARHDDPILLTVEVKARGVALQNQVLKLLKRKVPKKTATSETTTATKVAETVETTTAGADESTRGHDEL